MIQPHYPDVLSLITETPWEWEDMGNDTVALTTIIHPDRDTRRLLTVWCATDLTSTEIHPSTRVWVVVWDLPNLATPVESTQCENMTTAMALIESITNHRKDA